MTRITSEAVDKVNAPITDNIPNLIITTNPVVITAVQRKAFIGNYETVDVYCGVALPVHLQESLDQNDLTQLEEIITAAVETGFSIVSKETGKRYRLIKESIKEGQ